MTIKQQGGIFGRNPTFNDVDVEGTLTVDGSAIPAPADTLTSSDIGVTVQQYDAATAKTNVSQTFTALQNFNFAGGGNYVATFQTTSTSTPYTVNISETSGSANGYPLFRVGQSYSPFTDYFRVDSGTSTNITVGKNLAMANGKGIDFSATSGTGTSELFSDYEEGNWTPVWQASTTNPTLTYTNQLGYYTKIGNVVYLSCFLRTDAVSDVGSGNARIGGLPYTCANDSGKRGSVSIGNITNIGGSLAAGYVQANGTYLNMTAALGGASNWNISNLAGNQLLQFSAVYMTA